MADVTLQWNKGERDSSIRNIQVVKPNGLEPAARGQETKPVSMYPRYSWPMQFWKSSFVLPFRLN